MAEIQVKIIGTGPVGPRGEAGASAYEQALRGGYPGTEAEFNADLANFKTYAANTQEGAAAAAASAVSAGADAATATAKAQQAETDAAAAAGSAAAANAAKTAALDAQAAAEEAAGEIAASAAQIAANTADIGCLKENDIQSAAYLYSKSYTSGQFTLNANSGVIDPVTGNNTTSNKYCRTNFLSISSSNYMAVLGLPEYEWTICLFSEGRWGPSYFRRCCTQNKFISSSVPVFFNRADGENNVLFTFRRVDQTKLTTDVDDPTSDFYKIRAALKLYYNPLRHSERNIMWFGDSIARGVMPNLVYSGTSIESVIARELGCTCANFGIGNLGWVSGYNSSAPSKTNAFGYMKRVGDPDWYKSGDVAGGVHFRSSKTWADFDTVIIALGVNDNNWPLGRLDDPDIVDADAGNLSLEEVLAWQTAAENTGSEDRVIVKAMYQCYRYIRSVAPHIHIILVDPLPTASSTDSAPDWGYDRVRAGGFTRRQLNSLYAEFAKKYGLGHISTYDAPLNRVSLRTDLTDGVHPNEDAYIALGMYFAAKLGGDSCWAGEQEAEIGPGTNLLPLYGSFKTKTISGIRFEWSGWESCRITGTATAQAIYNIIDSRKALPSGIRPGDALFLRFSSSPKSVTLRYWVGFWREGDTSDPYSTHFSYEDAPIIVPEDAVGITVQLRVLSTAVNVNGSVSRMQLTKMRPMRMTAPHLMVSFVDDDTTNATYVEKYRDACLHNGVVGNYAMVSSNMGGSTPDAENANRTLLLQYEGEGFGMLTHGDKRQAELPWQSMDTKANRDACRADLCNALRLFRKWGFCNYNFWVTPYGIHKTNARRLARELGFRCLISTNNGRHNAMQDFDRLYIRRVALRQDDAGDPDLHNTMADVKAAIDATVAAGGGWLIITTHFNEWGGLSWDETLDENNYPVGYARFNEMVQYALDAGLTPVTVPEAWENYEPVLEANRELIYQGNV